MTEGYLKFSEVSHSKCLGGKRGLIKSYRIFFLIIIWLGGFTNLNNENTIEHYGRETKLKKQTYLKYSSLGKTRLIPVTFSYFR